MLDIVPVEGSRQIEEFIRIPGRLSAADPNWVEPLWFERRRFLSPRTNPFFEHAEVAMWLAQRNLNRQTFREQLELQLLLEKMVEA